MSTVHKLAKNSVSFPADPVFELTDLAVGSVLEFHSATGEVIVRKVAALFRNWKLERKGSADKPGDILVFDDRYMVGAGYAWRSVQWRLAA